MSRKTPLLITAATRYDPAKLQLVQTFRNDTRNKAGKVQQRADWRLSYDGHTDFRGLFTLNSMGRYTRPGTAPDMTQPAQITCQAPSAVLETADEWARVAATFHFFEAMYADMTQRWRDTPAWYEGHGPDREGAMPPKKEPVLVDGQWVDEVTEPADMFKTPYDPPTMSEEVPDQVQWPGKLRFKLWKQLDDRRRVTHAIDGAPMTVRELEELTWPYRYVRREGEEPSVRTLRSRNYHMRTTPLERRTAGVEMDDGEAIPPPLAEMTVWPTFWYSNNPKGVLGAGVNFLVMEASVFVSQERAYFATPPTAGLWTKDEYELARDPPAGAAAWYVEWWRAHHREELAPVGGEPPAKRARTSSEAEE